MGEPIILSSMKYLVGLALLQLVTVLQAVPQEGSLLKRLLQSEHNLCGAGVRPSCSCGSDPDLTPESASDCPEGLKDLKCFCPEGNEEIDLDAVRDMIKAALVSSPSNPCGAGNEMTCVCPDGKEAAFGSGPPCAHGRSKEIVLPKCSCPDGKEVKVTPEMARRYKDIFNFKDHVEKHHEETIFCKIFKSNNNPCGARILGECKCISDGSEPTELGACPGGIEDLECSCPNGNDIDEVGFVETVRTLMMNSPRNPCGKGNEVSCQCENGDKARFEPGNHCDNGELPVSCSCPDGKELEDIKQLIHNVDHQFHPCGHHERDHDHDHHHDHNQVHEHDLEE